MIHGLTFKEYVEEEKTKLSEMNKAEKIVLVIHTGCKVMQII